MPNDPALDPLVFSLQAAAGLSPTTVSNTVRLTPALPGSFEPALNVPALPIAGGGIATAADGELLFVGGSGPAAQHYKSRTEEWELFGSTFGVGLFAQTTGLADGRVLFTGGLDPATGQPTANAALYDPIAQTTTTLTMNHARAGHGASLMGNGKVLITGGFATFNLTDILGFFAGIQNTTEIYDPVVGTFTNGPNLLEARALHSSTTISSGQVLIAGGMSVIPFINIPTVSATAYRFNPTTNSFSFLPASMNGGRFLHSAVALSNGKVLIAGGVTLDLTQVIATGDLTQLVIGTLSDCQVYTPSGLNGTFATVAGMSQGRAGAGLVALPNGSALIAGGMTLALNPGHGHVRDHAAPHRRSVRQQQHDHADRLDGRRAVPAGDGQSPGRDRDGGWRRSGDRRDLPALSSWSAVRVEPKARPAAWPGRSSASERCPTRLRPRRDFVDAYGQAGGPRFARTRSALRRPSLSSCESPAVAPARARRTSAARPRGDRAAPA